MAAKVLVIGGAGYIGSVCAEVLRRAGHQVTIFDDLSTGRRAACHDDLIVGDIRDRAKISLSSHLHDVAIFEEMRRSDHAHQWLRHICFPVPTKIQGTNTTHENNHSRQRG